MSKNIICMCQTYSVSTQVGDHYALLPQAAAGRILIFCWVLVLGWGTTGDYPRCWQGFFLGIGPGVGGPLGNPQVADRILTVTGANRQYQ